MQITIESKQDGQTFSAEFEPVRTVREYTIGWATVRTDDLTLRFPAITTPWGAITVKDWQTDYNAVWPGLDLADPEQVKELIATGSGSFYKPKSGNDTGIANHFAA